MGKAWALGPWEDLAHRPPGHAVAREATRRRSTGDSDASWRLGADGEALLAGALDGLLHPRGLARVTARGTAWRVLHSVPVGLGHTDIDHVLIGPPGVVTGAGPSSARTSLALVDTVRQPQAPRRPPAR